jgi:hypothetical protein
MTAERQRQQLLAALSVLYREVDQEAHRLAQLHRSRLGCGRGCPSCCVDGITVFEIEAENIRQHHADLLATGTPHPEGACAFLDERGACRIYADRPYVCRTQGLPLRWTEETADGSRVERRDICPLNEDGRPVQQLPPEECWTLGPIEGRLASLQHTAGTGQMARVRLRDLFAGRQPTPPTRKGDMSGRIAR